MKKGAQTIFTIGFTKKSAKTFFELIKGSSARTLIDIRLHNSSQLAGFSKGDDLEYFLKELCNCSYRYEDLFAPTKELMENIRARKVDLAQFEDSYRQLMAERQAADHFDKHYAEAGDICLLCSEDTPEYCHRRVLAEILASGHQSRTITHL